MQITKLEIKDFRRIHDATIHLQPASFIVGPNNTAKSSIIAALEALLSLEKESLSQLDILERPDHSRAGQASITAYISNIPPEVAASRGFRGRVVNGEFVYRKSLSVDTAKPKIETREYPSSLRPAFQAAKKVADLIAGGIAADIIRDALGLTDPQVKLPKDWPKSLPEALDFDVAAEPTWVENPGGIPPNVLSRLPRLIHIPALTEAREIDTAEKKYALGECLSLLFEDLIKATPLATEIQQRLDELEGQMNPNDEHSLLHTLVTDVNAIIADVFPRCGIAIEPSLQDLIEVLRPKYDIKVFSNIQTGASRQGTGLVRTIAFSMLRYHAKLKLSKELQTRPVLVAFEEPELFLHPSAANLLRDTIYSLGQSDQIVCSTHSPWMIDLSKNPQSITRMRIAADDAATAWNYGVSSALGGLPADDRLRVKMLQIFDDELSRVFFADKVLVVEGDSEILAIRETLRLLPDHLLKPIQASYQIVKARGKASIISLVKYLRALEITPFVLHDGDFGVAGAERFNQPIADALGSADHLCVLNHNLEEAMGYAPPASDKPFEAYTHASAWATVNDIPRQWQDALSRVLGFVWP